MPTVHRTISSPAVPQTVHAYLADFENATEWDHGTVSCERTSGEGGPGTTYRNVSRFGGREVEVEYTTIRTDPPAEASGTGVVELLGRNGSTTLNDTMTVRSGPDGGTLVDYEAVLSLSGVMRLATPVMALLFGRLADKTERTMTDALARL